MVVLRNAINGPETDMRGRTCEKPVPPSPRQGAVPVEPDCQPLVNDCTIHDEPVMVRASGACQAWAARPASGQAVQMRQQ